MRPVLALALFVLGALFLAIVSTAVLSAMRVSNAATKPTALEAANAQVATPAATPEASPVAGVGFADRVNNAKEPIEALNSLLLEGVKLGAILLGSIIVVSVIRAVRNRPTELVVPDVVNATRDVGLADQMHGLSHEMRGRILEEMRSLRDFIETHSTRVGPDEVKLPRIPLPTELPDAGIKNMINAVADSVPGETKNIVQLVHAITPSRGVNVGISLVRSFRDGARPGVLMEVADLGGRMIDRQCVDEHASPRSSLPRFVEFLIHDERIEPEAISIPANVYVRAVATNVGSRKRTLRIPGLNINLSMAPQETREEYLHAPQGSYAYRAESRVRGYAVLSGVLTAEIDSPHSLGERYAVLARPAARWLAFRLIQWQLLDNPPFSLNLRITAFEHRRRAYVARMHNLLGAAKSAYGESGPECEFFFKEARNHFREAIKTSPKWPQPHENLADTLLAWGRQAERQGGSAVNKYRAARQSYRDAAELTERQLAPLRRCRDQGHCRSRDVGFWLRPKDGEQLLTELEIAQHRARIGAATTGLLLGDQFRDIATEEMLELGNDSFILATKDERLLRGLAIMYGLALRSVNDQRERARTGRFLLHALARDRSRSFWRSMIADDAFAELGEPLKDARDHLDRLLDQFPGLTSAGSPGCSDLEAKRGARATVERIEPGFTIFAADGPLGKVVVRLPADEPDDTELFYVARFSGARDDLWIPVTAIDSVYPLTKSAFIAATAATATDESLHWATPPRHVPNLEDRRFHFLIKQVIEGVGWS